MDIKHVGSRGILFTFYDLDNREYGCVTNVYTIIGKDSLFFLDTYLGPECMKEIVNYLGERILGKRIILFNSHYHWDHIWGNGSFEKPLIIAHNKCREKIILEGELELAAHSKYQRGDVKILLPNMTFNDSLTFEEEGLTFFYSPGHTEDSASCYDSIDEVLFVGDNVDEPIPSFICWNRLDIYQQTLENYLAFKSKYIVQSHGPVTQNKTIEENLQYIKKLQTREVKAYEKGKFKHNHQTNIACLNPLDERQ